MLDPRCGAADTAIERAFPATGHPAMTATSKLAPPWIEAMSLHRWYAISGDHPDQQLPATAPGTRYLIDTEPARDPALNPARTREERLRRMLGHEPKSPWHGAVGFSAITEAWNGAAYASRSGASGSMIILAAGTTIISVRMCMPSISEMAKNR
jgi:hypothetical protein